MSLQVVARKRVYICGDSAPSGVCPTGGSSRARGACMVIARGQARASTRLHSLPARAGVHEARRQGVHVIARGQSPARGGGVSTYALSRACAGRRALGRCVRARVARLHRLPGRRAGADRLGCKIDADSVSMLWPRADRGHLQLHPGAAPPALRISLALGRD